jgi:hypothetical protein
MVDLEMIPSEVQEAIINNFVTQPVKDKSQLLNYFIEHKMKQMMEHLEEF